MDIRTKSFTVTQAKKHLLQLVEDIEATHDRITFIKNGIPVSILLSLDDYEALIETLEILSNPKIMKSLAKSKKQVSQKKLLSDNQVW